MAIRIEFEGAGEGLQSFVKAQLDAVAQLRQQIEQTNAAQKQGAEQSVAAQQKVVASTEATVAAVAKLNASAKEGLSTSTSSANALADALKEIVAGGTGFEALVEEARAYAQEQGVAIEQLSEQKTQVLDLLVQLKAITEEEGKILAEAFAISEAFERQEEAARQATEEFEKQSKVFENQIGLIGQAESRINLLKQQLQTATDPKDIARINDQLDDAVGLYNELANASERTAEAAAQGLTNQVGLLDQLSSRIDLLNQKLDSASTPEAIQAINDELEEAQANYERVANASRASAQAQAAAIRQPIGLIDQPKSRIDLLQQKRLSLLDPKEIAKTNDELREAEEQFQKIGEATLSPALNIESLRGRLQQAKDEAFAIGQEFGTDSAIFLQAAANAGKVADQIDKINKLTDAFNPGRPLQAVLQLGEGAVGAFTAINSVISAVSGNSEETEKALRRVEQGVGFLIGAQSAIRGFKEGWESLRAVILKALVVQESYTKASVAGGAAQTAVGTASTAAAGGIRAFTASLISSPLAPFALALTAIGAAFALISSDSKDAKADVEGFFDTLEALRGLQTLDIDKRLRLNELQKDQALIGVESAREQGEITRQFAIRENELLKEKQKLMVQNADALDREIEAKSKAGDLDDEAKKDLEERSSALRAEAKQLETDIALQVAGANVQTLKFRQQIKEQELASAQERRQIREQLAKDLAAVEKQLADAVRASQLEQADPLERLRLEKQARDQEIRDLERDLLRKQALFELEAELGTEAFKALSEGQKEAKADALISEGDIQLALEQQDQLNLLLLNSELQYLDARTALKRENDELILSSQKDSADKQRAQLEIDLQARAEQLRKAGATEVQIAEEAARRRAALEENIALDTLANEEALAIARVEAIRDAGPQTEAAIRAAEEKILQIQIEFALKRLALIESDTTAEGLKRASDLRTLINKLKGELKTLQEQGPKFNLLDLLGVKKEDQALVRQIAQEIGSNLRAMIADNIEAQAIEVQASIDATDQIIADRERRVDDLRSQLDTELELRRQGLANNVQAIQDEIAAEEEKKKADIRRRQELLKEQKRIAQQQLEIDRAIQVGQLIVASAKIMNQTAGLGPFGIAIGIAEIAIMFAAFAAAQAKAQATLNANSLRRGGYSNILHGPTHEDGGLGIYNEKTGERIAEAEDGEAFFIVNKRTSNRRRKMIEALNEDDIPKVADLAIAELMQANNIQLKRDKVDHVVELKNTHEVSATITHKHENDELRKDVRALTEEVKGFRKQQKKANEETESLGPNGELIIRKEGVTIIRKKVVRG